MEYICKFSLALFAAILLTSPARGVAGTDVLLPVNGHVSGPQDASSNTQITAMPSGNNNQSDLPPSRSRVTKAIQGPNATKCTKLRASGASGWEPVTYLDSQNIARGVAVDILQEFAAQNRIDLEVNLDIPWNRAMLMLINGEIDVMAGAYFTKERDKEFLYSLPFASDDIMVFQNADHTFAVSEVRDLINHRGARPQGGSYGDFLDHYAADYLDIIFSPTGNRIMDLLITQRVDYVMLGRYDGLANIANDDVSRQIHMVERPLVANPVMFMFSRKSPCMKMVPPLNTFVNHLEQSDRLTEMTATHLPILPQN
tara:strand:+ start:943 stop:1881 length:939 start_codon:yes stop_codon:yes gene_type:complete